MPECELKVILASKNKVTILCFQMDQPFLIILFCLIIKASFCIVLLSFSQVICIDISKLCFNTGDFGTSLEWPREELQLWALLRWPHVSVSKIAESLKTTASSSVHCRFTVYFFTCHVIRMSGHKLLF